MPRAKARLTKRATDHRARAFCGGALGGKQIELRETRTPRGADDVSRLLVTQRALQLGVSRQEPERDLIHPHEALRVAGA